ncbi:MAG: hypothetical protein IJT73_01240 [Selenomonadaceae bacterium]|nr:hypothetical protein [Selenomonadaceae bacterium]
MDLTFIIVLWIIVSLIEALSSSKKKPPPKFPPPPDSSEIEFDLPPLSDDPNKSAEVQEINLAELYRQRKNNAAAQTKTETKNIVEEENKFSEVKITPESAMNAIIISEILDKPKSLRRKKF